jgi:hypothetical protein
MTRVAYLEAAENHDGPLLTHLIGVNQPISRTRKRFSAPHPAQLTCI